MLDSQGRGLQAELQERFAPGAMPPAGTDEDAFNALALRVFEYAFAHVAAYAGYCRARGATPDSVQSWRQVPAVPTAAFKELTLLAEGARAEAVFRTSGTTRGPERRGAHHVASLDLYQASLRPTFATYLLPDGAAMAFLSLMPPAETLPDSSLAFMITDVMDAFGAHGSQAFADAAGLDTRALDAACDDAIRHHRPVLLLGTSAAFIHWLTDADQRDLQLPEGSRLMDTGGFKGRGRRYDAGELRSLYRRKLGIPPASCVNEYGMTELLSQRYDDALRVAHGGNDDRALAVAEAGEPADGRRKAGPWWLRSVAVNPETLEPLPAGEPGILRHFDLANLGSVPAVQTEDFGRVVDGAVLLEGRALGAPPRGCSIAMDMLLEGS